MSEIRLYLPPEPNVEGVDPLPYPFPINCFGERRRELLSLWRAWLLAVVGDEVELEAVLDAANDLTLGKLADRLNVSVSTVEHMIERLHKTIYWAAVAELIPAILERTDSCLFVRQMGTCPGPLAGWDFVVPVTRARRVNTAGTPESLRDDVLTLLPRIEYGGDPDACLLARRPAGPPRGNDRGSTIVLEMAYRCRSAEEARDRAREKRQSGWLDLQTGEEVHLRRRAA